MTMLQYCELNHEAHAAIERQTMSFLMAGGVVQEIPIGVSGLDGEGRNKTYKFKLSNRDRRPDNTDLF